VTRYQHEANKTHGRPCSDDSREPCGWCLSERVETLSRLLDAANVRLRTLETRPVENREPAW
jgi:hypothetical protein